MKKLAKKAPVKERVVQGEQLHAATGGSGYVVAFDDGPPTDPPPTGGT